MEVERQSMNFDFSAIAAKPFRLIGKTLEFVQFFYHGTIDVEDYEHLVLPTDQLPFKVINEKASSLNEFKEESYFWLTQKAIEDFVLGISMGLVEANRLIRLKKIEQDTKNKPIESQEELFERLDSIDKKVNGMNFPSLITNLNNWIDEDLPLIDEVKSINNMRACFAHRDGIVNKLKDYNDSAKKCLHVKWIEYLTKIKKEDDKWIQLNYDLRKDGVSVSEMEIKVSNTSANFYDGDRISLDIDQLNSIGITCITFIKGVHERLKRKLGDEIKTA